MSRLCSFSMVSLIFLVLNNLFNIIISIYIFKYKTRTRTHTKPIPVCTGMGFHGYGYGFLWNTPGLPVQFPTSDNFRRFSRNDPSPTSPLSWVNLCSSSDVCGSHFWNFIYFLSFFICGATYWSRHWSRYWSHHLFIYFRHHSTLVYSTLSDRKVPILFFLDILSGNVWFVLVSFLIHLLDILSDILSAFWGLVATSGYFIFSARSHFRPDSRPYSYDPNLVSR